MPLLCSVASLVLPPPEVRGSIAAQSRVFNPASASDHENTANNTNPGINDAVRSRIAPVITGAKNAARYPTL